MESRFTLLGFENRDRGGDMESWEWGNTTMISMNCKKSLLKSCRCFSVEEWSLEDGGLPAVSCSLALPPPPPGVPLARKVGAEFIGTFILMFTGTAAAIVNQKTNGSETLIGCAATTGLAVMIVIFRHRPHLRCSSQPCYHHSLSCIKALPLEACAHVYWCTSFGI
ncbi:Aquaporin NIP6-1 [Glycine soja]